MFDKHAWRYQDSSKISLPRSPALLIPHRRLPLSIVLSHGVFYLCFLALFLLSSTLVFFDFGTRGICIYGPVGLIRLCGASDNARFTAPCVRDATLHVRAQVLIR